MSKEEKYFQWDGKSFEEGAKVGLRMRYAGAMIERWGMVAACPDGEDSSGRSKLRLATPEELVDRAYAVAALLVERGELDGLIEPSPYGGDFQAWKFEQVTIDAKAQTLRYEKDDNIRKLVAKLLSEINGEG